MEWIKDEILKPYPEILVFLTLALGFFIGKFTFKGFGLGAVTGTLVAGLILGQFDIEISNTVKAIAFLAFLFALGYKVGSQFFNGLGRNSLNQVALTLIVCVTGLLSAFGFAKLLGYDQGLGAGMLGGALTQSAVIGVAQDTINSLSGISDADKKEMVNEVPVAYAVTYVLGTVLCAVFLANIAPRLLRRNLVKESQELEAEFNVGGGNLDEAPGYYMQVLRAFRVTDPSLVGVTIQQFEDQAKHADERVFITKVRRNGEIITHTQDTTLQEGDVVAIAANRSDLMRFDPTHIGPEVDDKELLSYSSETLKAVVTKADWVRATVADVRADPRMDGVFIKKIVRADEEIPWGSKTEIHRGDTITLTGPTHLVERAAAVAGYKARSSFQTDMTYVSIGIVLGALIGIPAIHIGDVPLSLSTSGGALIMGLIFGWLRGRSPTFGNLPPGAQWLLDTVGLCLFVGVVGINAAPDFVSGLKSAGWGLLIAGAIITMIPLSVGLVVGRFLFKMKMPILLGALAGAQTTTAAIGAITEQAKSRIPVLGYTVPYAIGNVLLTLWGAVIVAMLT